MRSDTFAKRRELNSQQAQLARLGDRRRTIAYVELPKNPMQMALRGSHRDRHLAGNLLIAEPAADSPKEFRFPPGQNGTLSHQQLIVSPKFGRGSGASPHIT